MKRGNYFIVENPRNSYIWQLPGMKLLLAE